MQIRQTFSQITARVAKAMLYPLQLPKNLRSNLPRPCLPKIDFSSFLQRMGASPPFSMIGHSWGKVSDFCRKKTGNLTARIDKMAHFIFKGKEIKKTASKTASTTENKTENKTSFFNSESSHSASHVKCKRERDLENIEKKFLSDDEFISYLISLTSLYPSVRGVQNLGACTIKEKEAIHIDLRGSILRTLEFERLYLQKGEIQTPSPLGRNLAVLLRTHPLHWGLLYIDHEKKRIEYYDSIVYQPSAEMQQELSAIAALLSQKEAQRKKDPLSSSSLTPIKPYRVHAPLKKRVQYDGYQCGIWACYFLSKRLENPDFDFEHFEPLPGDTEIAAFRHLVFSQIHCVEDRLISSQREQRQLYLNDKGELLPHFFADRKRRFEQFYLPKELNQGDKRPLNRLQDTDFFELRRYKFQKIYFKPQEN